MKNSSYLQNPKWFIMARPIPKNIDEYIGWFPEETQVYLEQIRAKIRKFIPKGEEMISYGIPAFRLNNRYLIYFAGFKNHVSIYPAPRGDREYEKEVAEYRGGKGTLKFPLDKKLPMTVIGRVIKQSLEAFKERQVKIKK